MKNTKEEIRRTQTEQNRTIGLLCIALVIGSVSVFAVWKMYDQQSGARQPAASVQTEHNATNLDQQPSVAKTGYDVALARAKAWQPDAELSYVSQNGEAEEWEYIFVSKSKQGMGLKVSVSMDQIQAQEISYQGTSAPLPERLLSESEAIARVLSMPGYEQAQIMSIEAVYGVGTKTWYWGIETSKGRVSIEATR